LSNIRKTLDTSDSDYVIKVTNDMVKKQGIVFRKLHNTGELFLTKLGVYHIISKSRKKSIREKEKLLKKFNINDTLILQSYHEIEFFSLLKDVLTALNITINTQYKIKGLPYILDCYIPTYNLVIEYDEYHHKKHFNNFYDLDRDLEIQTKLNCKILRLDYRDSNGFNIGLVIKELFNVGGN